LLIIFPVDIPASEKPLAIEATKPTSLEVIENLVNYSVIFSAKF